MTILLLVFWGRKLFTKRKTVLRACSAASSFFAVVTLGATAGFASCFLLTAIGFDTGLTMELAMDEVDVMLEEIDGSADV